jgi:hypothetical protein
MNRNRPANGAEPKQRIEREHMTGSPSGARAPGYGPCRNALRCSALRLLLRSQVKDNHDVGRMQSASFACNAQFDGETARPSCLPMKRLSAGNSQNGELHPPYACCP